LVSRRHGSGLLVKHLRSWSPHFAASLAREAGCYWAVAHSGCPIVAELMPGFIAYDPSWHVLLIEALPRTESVAERRRRLRESPDVVDRLVGESLAVLHSDRVQQFAARFAGWVFPCRPPIGLGLHWWGEQVLQPLSPACVQLLALLRGDTRLCGLLDELRAGWRRDRFIHGDMKWENLVVTPDANGEPAVRLVDWEFADWGDAAWDVAGVLQSELAHRIVSAAHPLAFPDMLGTSECSPPWDGSRQFWAAYAGRAGSHTAFRDRCVRYTGARLIQTAFEHVVHQVWVAEPSLAMLRIGARLIAHPEDTASRLLGIEYR
jgi:hypothetical protein